VSIAWKGRALVAIDGQFVANFTEANEHLFAAPTTVDAHRLSIY
jgi:hypothetical protein